MHMRSFSLVGGRPLATRPPQALTSGSRLAGGLRAPLRAPLRATKEEKVVAPTNGHAPPSAPPSPLSTVENWSEDPSGTVATSSPKWNDAMLSVVVLGASGDLAKKKIYPALFALYYEGMLPPHFIVVGYSRTEMSDKDFRDRILSTLACRLDRREDCDKKMEVFLTKCFYVSGKYDSATDFKNLHARLNSLESACVKANRTFYLSLPPTVYEDACKQAQTETASPSGWTRYILEKPFGRDLPSYRKLSEGLATTLTEEQMFRIDHYLGKELIENLTVLRFANLVFEPLWSRQYIKNVQITFTENFGTEGRGGYFDQSGIIRDIIQNHLLQVLTLFAMEPPVSLAGEDIRNEKVKVVKSMLPLKLENVVLGQYKGRLTPEGKKLPGYSEDPTVPPGSTTATFAAMALFINNARWDGVPFLLKAGKALNQRIAEIRIQFHNVPGNLYAAKYQNLDRATNELVIRIQPKESIYLKINNKVPGLGLTLDQTKLDLQYHSRYKKELPDAYERLILDVINGDKRMFVRGDELEEAWKLFTPLLAEIEDKQIQPELYPYGSRGPIGGHYLAAKYGVKWGDHSDDAVDDV